MECKDCKNLINAYLEGELEGEKFFEVERHINQCADCRAETDRLIRVRELLKELREVEVPPGEKEAFVSALRNRLDQERSHRLRRQINLRPVFVFAAAVVIIVLLMISIPRRNQSIAIAPAPGMNKIGNAAVDGLIQRTLDDHFIGASGDFLSEPFVTAGQIALNLRVTKETHRDLLETSGDR